MRGLLPSLVLMTACTSPAPTVTIERRAAPECREAADCGAPTPCETRCCEAGTCRRALAAKDSLATRQSDHDCKRVTCDENGAAVIAEDASDGPPDDANVCTVESCEQGQPRVVAAAVRTRCEGDGVCARDRKCLHFGSFSTAPGLTCTVVPKSGDIACLDDFDPSTRGPSTTRVPDVTGVSIAAIGRSHSCAAFMNGEVACWGDGYALGLGGPENPVTIRPDKRVVVAGLANVVDIVTGDRRTCARAKNGDVSCWGGAFDGKEMPVVAAPKTTTIPKLHAIALAGSDNAFCAVDAGGAVFCWGFTGGASAPEEAPERIASLSDAVAVAVGGQERCAIRKNGSLVCWSSLAAPAPMKGLEHTAAVALANSGGCALSKSGEVTCFPGFGADEDDADRKKRRAIMIPRADLHGARRLIGSSNAILIETRDGTFTRTSIYDQGSELVDW